MHTGSHYHLKEFLYWTRREIYCLIVFAAIPTVLYQVVGYKWVAMPWVPVALVGTASAFIIGFKNTQTYNRLWEARQIWGAIVNSSRAWGIMVQDFVKADKAVHSELIYRHCAWLTALRYQLRRKQPWENMDKPSYREYSRLYTVAEWVGNMDADLKGYLTAGELAWLLDRKNRATQVISLQSAHLARLRESGQLGAFEHVEMERRLADLYEQQGKCERIKNFPYPRQFASINFFFVRLFVFMLPFGMLNEFAKIAPECAWLTIPASVIVSWVFMSMEKIGEATENPFEGNANDVPITALSRSIEIDLRDMLGENSLPEPITPVNNILT